MDTALCSKPPSLAAAAAAAAAAAVAAVEAAGQNHWLLPSDQTDLVLESSLL